MPAGVITPDIFVYFRVQMQLGITIEYIFRVAAMVTNVLENRMYVIICAFELLIT